MAGSHPLTRRLLAPVLDRIDARAAAQAAIATDQVRLEVRGEQATRSTEIAALVDEVAALAREIAALRAETVGIAADRQAVFVPAVSDVITDGSDPFMQHSTCSATDFRHPRFSVLCETLGETPQFHRKVWEFAFIVHHLSEQGMLTPGRRGLGFGVGREPLPAAFAATGAEIVATDAPTDVGVEGGWARTDQHTHDAAGLSNPGLCDPDEFARLVAYRSADMNSIDDDLVDFDFCWSSCCFEHLGSIRHGLDFVVQSVERCLRPGGVAVHTTEFNLSSNDETLESVGLSLFRRRDLEGLVDELRTRGHHVAPFVVAPDSYYLDHVVDLPPYQSQPHLKLQLEGYTTTSAGLVITRGDRNGSGSAERNQTRHPMTGFDDG